MYPHLRLDSFLDRRSDASCRCVIIALAWVISMTPWYLRTAVSGDCLVWFLRLIHCPNLCKNTDGTSATSKKLLSDQWESMRQWDVEKIHPGKLYSHADSAGRFHWCRPQRSQIEIFQDSKNRRSRADLRCGSKRAFAIASFPGIQSFLCFRVPEVCNQNVKLLSDKLCNKILWVATGKSLNKTFGMASFGLWIQELSNEITRLTEAMSNRCHPCISWWFWRKLANFA